ncbi:patatin-like phospholipase family protein [Rhizobium leguminosarum]|uniref:patatin-like phospholipase family protein n=1 Tax=Rhizobium leguminosarum TaxID=384 RepID=UPI00160E5F6A|nr:patatin-like phospholipase family protein [Rhizobium leguminosarum]MBB4509568.1 uncharacterized protein YacL [Rhizobium leguminosarum]
MDKKKRGGLLTEHQMLEEEAAFIWGERHSRPDQTSGIALSGGGIRAAIVALGVLQSLAEQGLLRKFDYISTVSGGGYIGSALSWFWSSARIAEEGLPPETSRFGCAKGDFPFQDADSSYAPPDTDEYGQLPLRDKAIKNLWFLRNHGSYLTSGDGVGFAALIIAVVRTVLISLLVWTPLLVGIFWAIERLNGKIGELLQKHCDVVYRDKWCGSVDTLAAHPLYLLLLIIAFAAFVLFVLTVVTLSLIKPAIKEDTAKTIPHRVKAAIPYLAIGLVISALVCWYFLRTYPQVVSGTVAVLGALIATRMLAVGAAKISVANTSYFLRRTFDKWSYAFIPASIAILFLGSIPFIVDYASRLVTEGSVLGQLLGGPLGGILSLLSGVGTALYGYYVKAKSILPGLGAQTLALVGSLLFLVGLLLCSFVLAQSAFRLSNVYADITVLSLFVLSIILGVFSSVNATGLHRFYRDRLMETFMPMAEAIWSGHAKQSDVADTLSIADIRARGVAHDRPYHLINTHAILVGDKEPKVALRGGDNFLLSAAVVGSATTGWLPAKAYVQGNGPLTLASAMAASGAAANANAGYIGKGITRERFVSAVMSTLNIRLGLWICNPWALAERQQGKRRPMSATYFGPALFSGIFGLGNHRTSNFIEISDGGHFENLGLYELVRRKACLILAVDAEQDGEINLSSLVSSANRIKEDFGATIRFLETRGPEVLIGQESHQYPGGVKIAKSPYIIGEIAYKDGSHGALIYIKATMISGLDFATDGYRAANPDFPHQTTVDQFFDPEQFEAYRDLGRKSCNLAIKELSLRGNPSPQEILAEYGFGKRLS